MKSEAIIIIKNKRAVNLKRILLSRYKNISTAAIELKINSNDLYLVIRHPQQFTDRLARKLEKLLELVPNELDELNLGEKQTEALVPIKQIKYREPIHRLRAHNLRVIMEARYKNINTACAAIGVNSGNVHGILNGLRFFGEILARNLEQKLGLLPGELDKPQINTLVTIEQLTIELMNQKITAYKLLLSNLEKIFQQNIYQNINNYLTEIISLTEAKINNTKEVKEECINDIIANINNLNAEI